MMAVTVERLGPTRVRLDVDIPGDELDPALRTPAAERGGRPLPAQQEAALLSLVRTCAAEHGLSMLGRAEVERIGHGSDGALRFTAMLDVRPEFELPDLSSIVLTVEPVTIDEHEVDDQLEHVRRQYAALTDVDRPAADGDVVYLDLSLKVGSAEVPGGCVTGVPHEIGSGWPLAGLDPAVCGIGQLPAALDPRLVGLRSGESTTVTLRLVGGDFADREATATATVTRVAEQTLPELDDAFASAVLPPATGVGGTTMSDLRTTIRTQAIAARSAQRLRAVRDQVLDRVANLADVPVPASLQTAEIEARHDWLRSELHRLGTSVEAHLAATGTSQERLDQDIRAATTARIRGQLVLDALATAEGLRVGHDEIEEMAIERTRHATPDELATDVRRAKALALLLQRVSLRDPDGNPVSIAELRKTG